MGEAFNQAAAMIAWFGKPVIPPWLGAFCVFIVLLLVHTRVPLLGSKTLRGRTGRSTGYWLLLMIILVGIGPFGPGGGGTQTGPTSGEKNADTLNKKDENQTVAVVANMPAGISNKVVLMIEFIPSISDSAKAREFACDLIRREVDAVRRYSIRAEDAEHFIEQLQQQLLPVHIAADLPDPEVKIKKNPYPGEAVLRRIQDVVISRLPRVSVDLSE